MYEKLLGEAGFYRLLLRFDEDLASGTRALSCWRCGKVLHVAHFTRKPRGVPPGLGERYRKRFSFCCADRQCRKRRTCSSLRCQSEQDPALAPVPSYSSIRRFFQGQGWRKRRRLSTRETAGAERAEARLAAREVRSYEAEYVGGLFHRDCNVGSRPVLTARGQWATPVLFGVFDDRSRLACRLQWYLQEMPRMWRMASPKRSRSAVCLGPE